MGITKTNGFEVSQRDCIPTLRDKTDVGRVCLFLYFASRKNSVIEGNKLRTDGVPEYLKETRIQAIKAWGFGSFKVEHSFPDFIVSWDTVKHLMSLLWN